MLTQLKRWWVGDSTDRTAAQERLVALEREAQTLRLELAEREKILANLETALARQRNDEERRITEAVELQLERLLAETATPLTQLLTQAHLLEVASRPLQAKDVLAVAKRLIRVLEQMGLQLDGAIGQAAPFDPDQHEPLSADVSLAPGRLVVVRFAGVSFRGKLLRKAKVEAAET